MQNTAQRVPRNTDEDINRRIARDTEMRINFHANHPETIDARLRELDEEWDIERVLEANASALALGGTVLGTTVDRRWYALPAVVAAFLFLQAVQGWCPPVPILRRLGVRTAREIDIERVALKVLRGDFGPVGPDPSDRDTLASHALQAARL